MNNKINNITEFTNYLNGRVKIKKIDNIFNEKIKDDFTEFTIYWQEFKLSSKYRENIYIGKTIDKLITYNHYDWINKNINIITLKNSFFFASLLNIEKNITIINYYVEKYKENNYRQDIIKAIEFSAIYILNTNNDENYVMKKINYLNEIYKNENPQNKDKYLINILKNIQNSIFKNNYKIIDNLISTIISNNGIGIKQLIKIVDKNNFIKSIYEKTILEITIPKKEITKNIKYKI